MPVHLCVALSVGLNPGPVAPSSFPGAHVSSFTSGRGIRDHKLTCTDSSTKPPSSVAQLYHKFNASGSPVIKVPSLWGFLMSYHTYRVSGSQGLPGNVCFIQFMNTVLSVGLLPSPFDPGAMLHGTSRSFSIDSPSPNGTWNFLFLCTLTCGCCRE